MSQTDSAGIASAAARQVSRFKDSPSRISAQLDPQLDAFLIPGSIVVASETQVLTPTLDSHVPAANQTSGRDSKLDMKAFVQAVTAAFPEPRDPVGRPIAPPRPERAVRTFIFMGEGLPHEDAIPPVDAREAAAGGFNPYDYPRSSSADRPLVRPVLEAAASFMLDTPYDPILDGAITKCLKPAEPVLAEPTPGPTAPPQPKLLAVPACGPLPEHERHLVETVLEPLEPLARPSLPLRPATWPQVAPPLTPSQRAQRARPNTLRDRNGQLAPVTYTVGISQRS